MLATKMGYSQDNQCKFCGAKFHKHTTLSKHMCVKKQRYADLALTGSRLGLRAFQRFFERTSNAKTLKTDIEFINSPYYIDFVKFGNYLALLKPVYIEQFVDFVITGGVKLKDWTKGYVYDLYIEELVKKEPAESAVSRSITTMDEWCTLNNKNFNEFFTAITANEAAHLIKTGKISPWVLYLASTGGQLMDRFNEDHAKMIGAIIDPGAWMNKFKRANDDVAYIKSVLDQANL